MNAMQKMALLIALVAAKFAMIAALLMLGACASAPPTPQWQIDASDSLRRATEAYLEGRVKQIPVQPFEADLKRARDALSATGQPAQLARAELAFCAAQVASLDAQSIDSCARFEPFRESASAADLAYERYLHGRSSAADTALLPEHHRSVAAQLTIGNVTAATLADASDPLARLIAAASALQAKQATPSIVELAVNTASSQGWRRPLLAWLGVQLKLAQAANDTAAVHAIERRVQIAGSGL